MKILMICTVELGKNGISTWIKNYSGCLAKRNNQVAIVPAEKVAAEVKNELEDLKCKVHTITSRKSNTIKYFFELIEIIKLEKYDVVHVHGNSCTMALELIAAMVAGCRVRIAHSHNTTCDYMRAHKLLRPFFEMACNGRIACGDAAGKWLFRNREFIIVNNGIQIEKYQFERKKREKIRAELGIADNEVLLGHVGLFNYQKNHEFLIEIFKSLHKDNPRYHLVCIGDGENKMCIQKSILDEGLENAVIFTGNISNVSDYLQAMDVFLLPSRYEGLPFVLIEAQAAGLPCIVSENVAREADVSNTLKFLPLEIEQWRRTINTHNFFIRNIATEKMKQAGFDICINCEELVNLYKKMLGNAK